jgi:hypothetical protein
MKQLLAIVLGFILATTAPAQQSKLFTTDGVAIKGYDPVAYFTLGKATVGTNDFTFQWNNALWKFSNAEHLALFKANPNKYAPQYGGYCAYGCSENHQSPTDPLAWTILNGKLYLNYSAKVKSLWIKDTDNRIISADKYWLSL